MTLASPDRRVRLLLAAVAVAGLVVVVHDSFVAGPARTWGWASAPLFVYGAVGGLAVVAAAALLAGLRPGTPPPVGATWVGLQIPAAAAAAISAGCLVLTQLGSARAAWLGLLAAGVAGTAGLLERRSATGAGQASGGSTQPSGPPPGPAGAVRG